MCYDMFIEDPLTCVAVNCNQNNTTNSQDNVHKINMPSYLIYLFDNDNSPIWAGSGFSQDNIGHDIDADVFKLIMKWLLNLVMRKTLPTVDMLIEQEMNIDEWIHITDYFNIPVFIDLFTKLKKSLE